jgi:hypothetical protein
MTDPDAILTLAGTALAGLAIFTATTLRGWSQWLELKRLQAGGTGPTPSSGRSEVAELRARVRKLEAIANGTDV